MAKKKTEAAPPRRELVALLEACKAAPEDDAARLVLADWLEEHGNDADRERAEFVRLEATTGPERGQPALTTARSPWWDRVPWVSWVPWLTRHPQAFSVGGTQIAQGLLGVGFDATKLSEADARAIAADETWAWVASVSTTTRGQDVPRFLDCPLLERVPTVTFAHCTLRRGERRLFDTHPRVSDWRSLRFVSCQFGRTGPGPLLRSDNLAAVRSLTLSGLYIAGKDRATLFEAGVLPRLQSLRIQLYEDSSGAGPFLRNASFRLRRLQITAYPDHLAEALAADATTGLTDLDCSGAYLPPTAGAVLAVAPFLAGLRSLRLSRCQLHQWPVVLVPALSHAGRLRVLDLSRNDLRAGAMEQLARSSLLERLTFLDLSGDLIGPQGAAALTAAERAPLAIDLSNCGLGDEGLEHLAAWPGLSGCRVLWLDRNGVSDCGVRALVASPRTRSLRSLSVSGNHALTDAGLEFLVRSPLGDQVEELRIDGTPAGAPTVRALLAADVLRGVRELHLDHTLEDAWGPALRERFAPIRGFTISLPF